MARKNTKPATATTTPATATATTTPATPVTPTVNLATLLGNATALQAVQTALPTVVKKPSVIKVIQAVISTQPATKHQILTILHQTHPAKSITSMQSTVNAQLSNSAGRLQPVTTKTPAGTTYSLPADHANHNPNGEQYIMWCIAQNTPAK